MAKRAMALMALLAAACLAVGDLRGQAPAKKPTEEPLLKVEGQLTRDDPLDPVLKKGFHKVYPVKLTAGVYWQIDLVSKDFDAYLRLEDAKGKRLAEDDDSGGDLNSRIVYKADVAASFRVIVTTYDAGKTGKFVLTIKEIDEATAKKPTMRQDASALNAEGMRLYQQAKFPEATQRFRQAFDLFRQVYPKDSYPQGHADLALSLNNLGVLLQAQGEYAQAEPFLRQALEMRETLCPRDKYPDGHPDLAVSLNNLGELLRVQAEYGKAEPLFRRALDMNRTLFPRDKYPQGHPAVARALNNLGSIIQDQGEFSRAEPFYREALKARQLLYPRDKHPQGHANLANSLNNMGSLLHGQGEYAKAEPFFRQALAMRQTLYPKAKYPKGDLGLAVSLSNLGSLLKDQGEHRKAEPFFRQALEMKQLLYPMDRYPRGHPDLALSLNNLGTFLQAQSENGKAEPFFRQALEMRQTLYPKNKYPQGHPDLAQSLSNLGHLLHVQGEYDKAEPIYRQALAMRQAFYPKNKYPRGHPELARILNNLGGLVRVQGDYAGAEPIYRQALEMNQTLYPSDKYPQGHPDLARSLNNLGHLFDDQGEHARAEPFCRQALEMYTQLANRLAETAPEAVAVNAAYTFPLARDSLLSATWHLPGLDPRTYDAVWHSRAALTRVYQRRHLALIAAATDEDVRKAWDDLQALRRQREQLIMAPTPKDPRDRDERLRQLNRQIDTIELDLLPRLPALKHYEDLAKLGPDSLRKLLPLNAVLVDFLRCTYFEQAPDKPGIKGEKRTVRYLAFVVSRQNVQRVELGSAAAIEAAVRQWRTAVTARLPAGNDTARKEHEARLAGQAAALRRLLWEPIEQRLPTGAATVYLAPDAELTQLPWAALPGKGKDRVLLEDYALAVLPHGPFLLEQLTPPPPRSNKRPPVAQGLLLVGGIRYDDQPNAIVVASRGADNVVEQQVVWSYLQGTDEERKLLTKVLEKTGPKLTANLSGTEAATARLRHELERCRYAHVGTHGFFADAKFRSVLQLDPTLFERTYSTDGHIGQRIGEGARSPLVLSGLVCAGANRAETPERGILSADAVTGLLLDDLHLAVLSACDTGIGDVAGGEGVFGLQRAFHIAGCKNVVASLWKVDDAATAALMTRFYGYMFADDQAKRLPPIEALRRAQLDLYRYPELIPAWAQGEQRAPGPPRPATTPAPADTPPELLTSDGRTPIRLWAAFTLSGLGR